jgi:hypothetical protein
MKMPDKALFAFAANDFTALVVPVGANVMAQMHFTGGGFHSQGRVGQKIVGTVHATLGRGFFVLLNSHDYSLMYKTSVLLL